MVCENTSLIAKGINKSLKLKLPINSHELLERFSCGGESDCMNGNCDSCSTLHQRENDGSTSSEDEESLNDSNDVAGKETVTFYRWGKPKELKRYALQFMKMKHGKNDVKS